MVVVGRRRREVALLGARLVAEVRALVGAGVPLPLDGVDPVEAAVRRGLEAHVVEDEELRLGAEVGGVGDAGGEEVLLRLLGDVARVAAVALAGDGVGHVAVHHQRLPAPERVEVGGVGIGDQHHVATLGSAGTRAPTSRRRRGRPRTGPRRGRRPGSTRAASRPAGRRTGGRRTRRPPSSTSSSTSCGERSSMARPYVAVGYARRRADLYGAARSSRHQDGDDGHGDADASEQGGDPRAVPARRHGARRPRPVRGGGAVVARGRRWSSPGPSRRTTWRSSSSGCLAGRSIGSAPADRVAYLAEVPDGADLRAPAPLGPRARSRRSRCGGVVGPTAAVRPQTWSGPTPPWTLAGMPRTARGVQVRTWNLSSLWRLPTARGTAWLKVVPSFFAHEGAILTALHSEQVPEVVAADGARALLAEVPGEDLYGIGGDGARTDDRPARRPPVRLDRARRRARSRWGSLTGGATPSPSCSRPSSSGWRDRLASRRGGGPRRPARRPPGALGSRGGVRAPRHVGARRLPPGEPALRGPWSPRAARLG